LGWIFHEPTMILPAPPVGRDRTPLAFLYS
jgi:hypothetical protein